MLWGLAVTVLAEAVAAYLRFHSGIAAAEFNKTAPLVLQIHHMFWSIPLLVVVPFVWRKAGLSGAVIGIALGLILSDLMHHFVVLPWTVGNTGWHWP
jgi:ABC-type proline/glycine betaine transport system permease subunit